MLLLFIVRQCFIIILLFVTIGFAQLRRKVDDKIECPKVKAIRNFDLEQVSYKICKRKTSHTCFVCLQVQKTVK